METLQGKPTRGRRRKLIAGITVAALAGSLAAVTSFDGAGAASPNVKYTVSLTGVGTGVPTTGTAVVQLKGKKKIVCVLIKKVGPNSTPKTGLPFGEVAIAAHIHAGPVNVAGPIVVPLATPVLKGKKYQKSKTCVDESANPTLFADLVANPSQYYVNVHTNAFPAGAIRGQLAP